MARRDRKLDPMPRIRSATLDPTRGEASASGVFASPGKMPGSTLLVMVVIVCMILASAGEAWGGGELAHDGSTRAVGDVGGENLHGTPHLIPSRQAFDATADEESWPGVIPVPQEASYPDGALPLQGLTLRVEGESPLVSKAAETLLSILDSRLGWSLPRARSASSGEPELVIGTLSSLRLPSHVRELDVVKDEPEGYTLYVGPEGVWVVGVTPQGAWYGVQTLLQLLVVKDGVPAFQYARIVDWPAFPVRMAMIYLDAYSAEFNDPLIALLARYKYNQVLVMSNYVQWDSAPNIWHPLGATKAEARRIAKLIRARGMEPVPLIELLGHVEWLFYNDQNRDLQQDPEASDPFAYDPLNPRTYEVILPILDEAVEVFRPRFLHIGHDEVRNRGRFPATEAGRAVGFNRLFYDDVMRLYGHLHSRGVGTMMWQDVAFSDATKEVVAHLPKDIIFTDWHYAPAREYPSIREIREAGFRVIGASWYRVGNAESFACSALPDGALGMLQTRWTGYFGNPTIVHGATEQATAYLRAAAAFWNPQEPISDAAASRRFANEWHELPWMQIPGRMVRLAPFATRTLVDADGSGWLGKGPGYDLAALVDLAGAAREGEGASEAGVVRLGPFAFHLSEAVMTWMDRGIARTLPREVTIPLGTRAAGLAILHTTAYPAPATGQPVGRYTLTYRDGTTVEVPLRYGQEIAAWTDVALNSLHRYPAWRGETTIGLQVGADVIVVRNPYPDKLLHSLAVTSEGRWANPVVLGVTLLDRMPGSSGSGNNEAVFITEATHP